MHCQRGHPPRPVCTELAALEGLPLQSPVPCAAVALSWARPCPAGRPASLPDAAPAKCHPGHLPRDPGPRPRPGPPTGGLPAPSPSAARPASTRGRHACQCPQLGPAQSAGCADAAACRCCWPQTSSARPASCSPACSASGTTLMFEELIGRSRLSEVSSAAAALAAPGVLACS